MRWIATDIQKYLEQKAFIDTVLIPLVPVAWGEDLVPAVREGEFILTLISETERQLQGRVVLMPPFTYLKNEPIEQTLERLSRWEEVIRSENVKCVFFVTADVTWKKYEERLKTLIWAAPIPLEHMDERYLKEFVDENVGFIMRKITEIWRIS
ncbi:DUF2487 family protein [Tuberibacillus calidus]|jgi:hypothetical protein|uniref:DUF2487 family protein n=1 Tax=Tuberibacillus calidus TaxID=340097 RepID=UPI0004202BA1|nr:DUF2487 family protein [Tuberibacillus calidus]